jgi:DNA polymerase-3 subunit alpha
MAYEEIKKEIIEHISKRHSKNAKLPKMLVKVQEELNILGDTDGLESKNNLEVFYNTWKNNKGKVGHKNEINSWTAFLLGFTEVKPDGEFLPTRRAFARAGFPDIDTDFDYENRDDVYAYIIDRYGRENVGNIGTHGLLKFKSCVTRVTKALDLANAYHKSGEAFVSENAAKVSEILSPFPKKGLMKITDDDGEVHLIQDFEGAYDHCPDFRHYVDKYESSNFKQYLEQIEGTFANFGSHAAGIVVSDIPLDEIAPLRKARKGMLATQYPNEDLEALGLIKFDVLAIATLTVIKKTVEAVKNYWKIEIDVENLPMDDEATFEIYRRGNLGGIFQCENYGMQKTMREIGVDRFEDVIAGLALYRPGPMDSIPEYCARKKGENNISYFHPTIEPFVKPYLEKTYGVLCFQEQVMQICNSLAGFTITDGYIMIKAIGKKKLFLMEKFETQFIAGCVSNGVPQEVAKQYWDKFITPFSSYGFNLAHSACYGYNSYSTAYLKANYPDEFICSLLDVTITSSNGDRHDKIGAFEREFKRKMGIKFLPRDINKCKVAYTIEKRKDVKEGIKKTEIRPSLLCKGLLSKSARNIEENAPYDDIRDLIRKTNSSLVDTRVVDALARGGYLGKKHIEDPSVVVKDFVMTREDMKKTAKKGVETVDMFA